MRATSRSLAGGAGVAFAALAEIDEEPAIGAGLLAALRADVGHGGAHVLPGLGAGDRRIVRGTPKHLAPAPARIDAHALGRERGARGLLDRPERKYAAGRQDDGRD